MSTEHRIVVVGGGAGGLELVTRLGKRLGKRGRAQVTLVDAQTSHLWKPLLHEVASGSLDAHQDDVNYIAQAHWNHFRFRLGRLASIDRERKIVHIDPGLDEAGEPINHARSFPYDTLVVAIGSIANDFRVPGVSEHCFFLDSRQQAERFHQRLLKACYQANSQSEPLRPHQLHIAIAGAGATGVELAAELRDAMHFLAEYGFERIKPERDIRIHIIEGANRVLPGLPERISVATAQLLERLGITLHVGERIEAATAEGFRTQSGLFIPAEILIWAAGIKAPDVLQWIGGLETNHLNQLEVRPTLQTTRDENIYAIGDCAACRLPGSDRNVPPRAQAAHQMATLVAKSIERRLEGKPLPEFRYVDYGSLVNLSHHGTVGALMGNLMNRPSKLFIEGILARITYRTLYKLHQVATLGCLRTLVVTIANFLSQRSRLRLKLH
jgi:NADH dehydrogenase